MNLDSGQAEQFYGAYVEGSMAKILIAEDDEFLREILSDYLTERGHQVHAVPNGKTAKDVVLSGGFELVISDVQMPYLNGVELLQWLRGQSKIPFIMMTGFTNLLETTKAADLGAQGFLSKPFSNADLLKLIQSVLAPEAKASEDEGAKADAQYCKVSLDEFVARPQIEFDIFVRLTGAKYLKVAHKGELLDVNRLRNYQAKGISHLYILKEDFDKLIDFNIQVCNLLQGSGKVSEEKKARFARYTGEAILERCFVAGMDQESFNDAQQFVEKSLGVITSNSQMLDMLGLLNEHSDYLYAHCLAVSIYSVMIAKQLNYVSPQTIFKLAMAGMFHDIGKKEIDRELLMKPRALTSMSERKIIESHVQRGREIMESIAGTPPDVIQMVYEHHEDEIEQGYPCATPRARLHPLSRIVHVADIFATRALKTPIHPGMTADQAVATMEKFDIDRLSKPAFAALKGLLLKQKAA